MDGGGYVEAAGALLARQTSLRPRTVVVLGSGQGHFTAFLEGRVTLSLDELPGVPPTGVEGHPGTLAAGTVDGIPIWVQAGRFHRYQGHGPDAAGLVFRALARLGVDTAVSTFSVGGIRPDLAPGSTVLLADLLNLSFRNPVRGPPRPGEARVPDMTAPFDADWTGRVSREASRRGIPTTRAVYAAVLGPSYETPAEIAMIRRLGGEVVGMSAASEVVLCTALGWRVLGLGLVTNRAAGLGGGRLRHGEVLAVAQERSGELFRVIRAALRCTPSWAL